MQLWKPKKIALQKIAYLASAGKEVIAGNTEAACDFKCLDLHNSKRYGLIVEDQKNLQQLTKVGGMPLMNQCAEIHSRSVDGLFYWIELDFVGISCPLRTAMPLTALKPISVLSPIATCTQILRLPFSKRGCALES